MDELFSSAYRDRLRQERRARMFLRGSIVGLCVAIFLGYFFYQTRDLFLEPRLRVTVPLDGDTIQGSKVLISGIVGRGLELTINGARAYSGEAGDFSEELLLSSGVHTIEIKARDRFGKESEVVRHIVVKE